MNHLNLPKIDLHCHLDGSVRPETILELATEQGITLPVQNLDELRQRLIAPETCPDLVEYLSRFEIPLKVMQTTEALERISFELFEDAAKENVKYMEVRFAPLLHQVQGLSVPEILQAVVSGLNLANQQYGIQGNYIICALRTMPKDGIRQLLDDASAYLEKGVAAFDLAGAELSGFCHQFIDEVAYARKLGFNITIHAGEQGDGQNVQDAIELLGAQRVGHGIHIVNHQGGYNAVQQNNTGLETCPSSNVQTKAVNALAEHPFPAFFSESLPVTINTDNRTVSNTTMTKEVQKVCETFNLSEEDYYRIYLNSVEQSFASSEVKEVLKLLAV